MTEILAYSIAPCLMQSSADGFAVAVSIDGEWFSVVPSEKFPPEDSAECTATFTRLIAATPRSKAARKSNAPIPIVAIDETGRIEQFASTRAAERAGHNRRNLWACRTGRYRKHHGRVWMEVG